MSRDHEAFAEFAGARSGSLFRTAFLMVGDHALAQDLLQEALTKTYVAWPRLRQVDKAEPYARRAIINTAISWKRRRHWYGEQPAEHLPETAAPVGPEPELRDLVWREILELPPRQRAVLVLRFYEDQSEAQIAETLGCARGTVKSQLNAAVRRLRARLGNPDLELVPTGKAH